MKARDTKENLFGNLQGSSILGNKTNMETSVPSQEQKMKHKLTIRFTLKKNQTKTQLNQQTRGYTRDDRSIKQIKIKNIAMAQ